MSWSPISEDYGNEATNASVSSYDTEEEVFTTAKTPSTPEYQPPASLQTKINHNTHRIEDFNHDEDEEEDSTFYTEKGKRGKEEELMELLKAKDSILQPEAYLNANVFLHELQKPKEVLIDTFCDAYHGYPMICEVLGDCLAMIADLKGENTSTTSSNEEDIDDYVVNIMCDFLSTLFAEKFTKAKGEELFSKCNSTLTPWLKDVLKDPLIQNKIEELLHRFPSSKFLNCCKSYVHSIQNS